MHLFWFIIYNVCIIPTLYLGLHIGGLFNKKIARGIRGRKNLFHDLENQLSKLPHRDNRLWVHVASVGEFEQAKPVIERAKATISNLRVIVSFFSPSGFENVSRYAKVDIFCYLPFDSYIQSKKFLKIVNPDIVVVVRHDIWPNYIWTANRLGVFTILIDASLAENSSRLTPLLKSFNRDVYSSFNHVLAISEDNRARLRALFPYPDRLFVYGDTRYDQVYHRAREIGKVDHLINSGVFDGARVFIAGSTWPSDEKRVLPAVDKMLTLYQDFICIIIPHEPTPAHVQSLVEHFKKNDVDVLLFTKWGVTPPKHLRVLIVDRMGLLANIYALGSVAFVGGGFGPGVHSVLEPVAHGIPVLFGPRHLNSAEALMLLQKGAGFSVTSSAEVFNRLVQLLDEPSEAERLGEVAADAVLANMGASEKIARLLQKSIIQKNKRNQQT